MNIVEIGIALTLIFGVCFILALVVMAIIEYITIIGFIALMLTIAVGIMVIK